MALIAIKADAPVFGIQFSRLSAEEIADLVTAPNPPREAFYRVHTANLDHIVHLTRSDPFRDAYKTAFLSTIDGAPLFLYARLRGLTVRKRVTGADLFPLILDRLQPERHKPFFVASNEETARRLVARMLAAGFAEADIGYAVPPHGFNEDPDLTAGLAETIKRHGVTHVFMGVGTPKSENWLYENAQQLSPGFGFAFGAALSYTAGTARRAPKFMQAVGLEWLWRVAHEPQRLSRRYFVNSWLFLYAIVDDLWSPWAHREQ